MTHYIYKYPVRKVQIYSNHKPWITATFNDPMRKRQIAKLRGNMRLYNTTRNEINHMSKQLSNASLIRKSSSLKTVIRKHGKTHKRHFRSLQSRPIYKYLKSSRWDYRRIRGPAHEKKNQQILPKCLRRPPSTYLEHCELLDNTPLSSKYTITMNEVEKQLNGLKPTKHLGQIISRHGYWKT